jgi:hypothetical protein
MKSVTMNFITKLLTSKNSAWEWNSTVYWL